MDLSAISASGLIWVDYGIIGLVGLSSLIGLFRGLVKEVFSLGLWIGAGWLALHYNHELSNSLVSAIPVPSARYAASFLLIFVGVLVLGGMVNYLLGKLISSTGLAGTDRLAGLLFGAMRGALIVSLMVLFAGVTPLPEDPWWKQSKLIPPFQSLGLWLKGQIPSGLASQVKFPELSSKR